MKFPSRFLRIRWEGFLLGLVSVLAPSAGFARAQAPAQAPPSRATSLELHPCSDGPGGEKMLCGTYTVYEDREAQAGRTIDLNLVVLKATGPDPRPDPVFYLAGGPGQAATTVAGAFFNSWMRKRHDLVFVDQRGTGHSHPLQVDLPGGPDDLQAWLDPLFNEEIFRKGLEKLRQVADLTLYSTPIAMDDVNEVRQALGYDKIDLYGGSYGSRAILVYLRRHPETVRTATVNGVAPIAFRNPLYHAWGAQHALDLLFQEVEKTPAAHKAFPSLREEFGELLARLEKKPAEVTLTVSGTGRKETVRLTRAAFAESLRVMMYTLPTERRVPLLIHRAWQGDYKPFVVTAIQHNRGLRRILAFGMLLCVTCAEDLARINEADIEKETRGTFLGDGRVRAQKALCAFWPKGRIPADYGEPVSVEVPVLLLSGTLDPVTPPRWGAEAASHLPHSLHLTVPGTHGVGGPCIEAIMRQFLETGRVEGLDTSCTASIHLPPLALPAARAQEEPADSQ